MMKMKEVRELFKQNGWSSRRDEAGNLIFTLPLIDRILQVIPSLKKTHTSEIFNPLLSVSTEKYNHAEAFIYGEDKQGGVIISDMWDPDPLKIQKEIIAAEDIINFIPALIDWAYAADINDGLKKYRGLPTSSPGIRPLWHLTALACNGDVDILLKYQQSFEQGDRLGFVPYITKDMIDRAVDYAKQARADSKPAQQA